MSYFDLINSAAYGETYTLTNAGGSIPVASIKVNGTSVAEIPIMYSAALPGGSILFQALPAGKYVVEMNCVLTPTHAGDATPINFAQLQLVDSANVVYGVSPIFKMTASGTQTVAGTYDQFTNFCVMNATIFITLTTGTSLTMRLACNTSTYALATYTGVLATNPALTCENSIVFNTVI